MRGAPSASLTMAAYYDINKRPMNSALCCILCVHVEAHARRNMPPAAPSIRLLVRTRPRPRQSGTIALGQGGAIEISQQD